MLRLRNAALILLMIGAVFSVNLCFPAEAVDDNLIMTAFQDSLNKSLYPNEMSAYRMTSEEVRKYVLPHAAVIIADAIKDVYKETRQNIGVEEVLGVLSPIVENVLREAKEITTKVNELLNINN